MRNGAPRREAPLADARRALGPLGQLKALSDALAGQTQEHPARTVALTFGTGFVLGGGLFSPLTARIVAVGVRIGLRLVALPIVIDGLGALATAARGSADDASQSRPETNEWRTSA